MAVAQDDRNGLVHAVGVLQNAALHVADLLSKQPDDAYCDTKAQIRELLRTLEEEFKLRTRSYHVRSKAKPRSKEMKRLRNQLHWARIKRKTAEGELKRQVGERISNRISHLWFIRVGLANPRLPAATLKEWCEEFPEKEIKGISAPYIGSVRDAMVEVVKELNRNEVRVGFEEAWGSTDSKIEKAPLYITHEQDEASMKFASIDSQVRNGCFRGKRSKVQSNKVDLNLGSKNWRWHTELQALLSKDAGTIATAMFDILKDILQCVPDGHRKGARVIHLVTGDAINTNAAACCKIYCHLVRHSAYKPIEYRLILWRCAAHKANLVVVVAICGRLLRDAVKRHDVCCNVSRLFRHLLPDYLEEFAKALRRYLERTAVLKRPSETVLAYQLEAKNLQLLYGERVLPDKLLELFNYRLSERAYVSGRDVQLRDIVDRQFDLLFSLIMKPDDNPVATRFWTFASCQAHKLEG